MINNFNILDVVALEIDLPEKKLLKGYVGTVVEILGDSIYLIEFSNNKGQVYAIEEIQSNCLMKLFYEPETAFI
jgi:hypothetical protein